MTETTLGSCLCGGVTFRISGAFDTFFLCHCTRCRKDTGSAHAANLFSSAAAISWLSGQDSIRTHRVPETRHERSFCGVCGSALPVFHPETGFLAVPAGSLDTPIGKRPDAHICCASRASWDDRLEQLPRLDGLPG